MRGMAPLNAAGFEEPAQTATAVLACIDHLCTIAFGSLPEQYGTAATD